MDVTFSNNRLKKILENERLIKSQYGVLKDKIINRISELRAVENLSLISHLPPPRKHKLSGNFSGCWSIDLSGNYRIIITTEEEYMNEEQIKKITIIDIIDYH